MRKLHLDHTSTIETIDNFTSTLNATIQNTITTKVKSIEIKQHQVGIDPTIREQITEKKQCENYDKGREYNTTRQNTIN